MGRNKSSTGELKALYFMMAESSYPRDHPTGGADVNSSVSDHGTDVAVVAAGVVVSGPHLNTKAPTSKAAAESRLNRPDAAAAVG